MSCALKKNFFFCFETFKASREGGYKSIAFLVLLSGSQVPTATFLKAAPSARGRAPCLKGTCPQIGPAGRGAPQNWTEVRRLFGGLRPRARRLRRGRTPRWPASAARPTSRAAGSPYQGRGRSRAGLWAAPRTSPRASRRGPGCRGEPSLCPRDLQRVPGTTSGLLLLILVQESQP